MRQAVLDGGIQTAVVMMLVATSALLGEHLTAMQVPQSVAESLLGLTTNRWAILALLNVFFSSSGCFYIRRRRSFWSYQSSCRSFTPRASILSTLA